MLTNASPAPHSVAAAAGRPPAPGSTPPRRLCPDSTCGWCGRPDRRIAVSRVVSSESRPANRARSVLQGLAFAPGFQDACAQPDIRLACAFLFDFAPVRQHFQHRCGTVAPSPRRCSAARRCLRMGGQARQQGVAFGTGVAVGLVQHLQRALAARQQLRGFDSTVMWHRPRITDHCGRPRRRWRLRSSPDSSLSGRVDQMHALDLRAPGLMLGRVVVP